MIREIGNTFDQTVCPTLLDELATALAAEEAGRERPAENDGLGEVFQSTVGAPAPGNGCRRSTRLWRLTGGTGIGDQEREADLDLMETGPLKSFATWARSSLITEVAARLAAVLAQGSPERVERPGVCACP